jgi:low temperature requirement protein LtrA
MVAGIVLFALGMKKALADVGDPLGTIPAVGLCGGVMLYLLAHVGLRVRLGGGLGHGRPTAVVVLALVLPLAFIVPAIVALALVAVVCTALIGYEAIRYRETRSQIRLTRQAPA